MPVRARIVLRPTGATLAPVGRPAEITESPAGAIEKSVRVIGVHQAGLDPLGLFLVVRRQRNIVVSLHAGINPEWLLEGVQSAHHGERASHTPHPSPPGPHNSRPPANPV